MTTIDLYRKHKAGEISREKFLYEVRRDYNLPFITNLTSYDDAVKILKNKGVITEASLKDLIKPLATKLESMGYEVDYDSSFGFMQIEAFKTLPDGSILRMTVVPSDAELQQKNYGGTSDRFSTIDVDFTHWTTKITKKLFGLYKSKTQVMNRLPDTEGTNIDLGTGMFDIPVEQSVDKIISLLGKAEQKAIQMSNNSLNEVDTKEAKKDEAVKAEVKAKKVTEPKLKELHIDYANPYEYRHGLAHELHQLDDYSAEALEKAKIIVLKNLAKDANFYSNLLNQQQSPYIFKQTETDKPGMQAKADGHLKKEAKKDEKANVKDNLGKKEAGKKNPKGVKTMPDKGVTGSSKTIKEGVEEGVSELADENAFEDMMKRYDWYAEMSDDSRKWDAQQAMERQLKMLAKKIGAERATEIWNNYAPENRKVQSSFFMMRENKITKIKEALKASLKEDAATDELAKKAAIQAERAKILALNKQKTNLNADTTKAPEVKRKEKEQIDIKLRAATDTLNKLNQGKITVV
jgi:hypothetical protein